MSGRADSRGPLVGLAYAVGVPVKKTGFFLDAYSLLQARSSTPSEKGSPVLGAMTARRSDRVSTEASRPEANASLVLVRLFLVFVLWTIASSPYVGSSWSDHLRVSFIDVGQGDAILIQSPEDASGRIVTTLIDGGPDSGNKNRLLTYLPAYGLPQGSRIDYVVVSHPHEDHYKGLLDILDDYEVATILDSGFPKGGRFESEFVARAEREEVEGEPANYIRLRESEGDIALDWGHGVDAEILYRDAANLQSMGSGSTRENNASTVIRMTFGNFSFLFMGDAEGKQRNDPASTTKYVEERLLSSPLGQLTVLKAGHHGSETGSTTAFLEKLRPDMVVVMSGRRKFGGTYIPDATVLERYAIANPDVTVLRTDYLDEAEGRTTKDDQDGDDIFMYSDGTELRTFQARGTPRQFVPVRVLKK